jgi:hypothetical protein
LGLHLPPSSWVIIVFTLSCAARHVRAEESRQEIVVVLRLCPALSRPGLLDGMSARVREARFVLEGARADLVSWIAEVCSDGTTLVSTLTDTNSGATDTRSMPVPADAGPLGTERLLANVLASQIRAARDTWTTPSYEIDLLGDGSASANAAEETVAKPMPIDFAMALGAEVIGGLNDRRDETTIALGPGLHLGLLVDTIGIVELGGASLSFLGPAALSDAVNVLALDVAGGCQFAVGPVLLAGLLTVFAERWAPLGALTVEGWRGGFGLAGRMVLPITSLLDVRLDVGIDLFPKAYTFGDPLDQPGEVVAELTNWRWRASLGLGIRFPVR